VGVIFGGNFMNKINVGVLLMGLAQASCSANGADQGEASAPLLADAKTIATMSREISAAGVDCSGFRSYTAALATRTVDCLGTIRPDSFSVNADNMLERNFTTCPVDATQLSGIDSLLLLQRREARLPHVKECMAGAYADYVRGFAKTGVTECPTWHSRETVNDITPSVIDRVAPTLADLHDTTTARFEFPADLEVENLYSTSFAGDLAGAPRESAVAGRACAAGFAGFVLQADRNVVLTDPVAWLLSTTYAGPSDDPFLLPGYYHPMSWYGGYPGVHYGHINRFEPCPGCRPELCTYYTGVHKLTSLQRDCIIDSEPDTCNSYCGPPLP
jgi:hypothetical protein